MSIQAVRDQCSWLWLVCACSTIFVMLSGIVLNCVLSRANAALCPPRLLSGQCS